MNWDLFTPDFIEFILDRESLKPAFSLNEPCWSGLIFRKSLGRVGIRAGELWGLQWGDIDWNARQIHVKRSLWKHQFQKPKTKNATRKIDMTERLARELKAWKLASPLSEHDLIFPSPEGYSTMHTNMMKRHFCPALRRAGLRQVSFHSLRHSNASFRIHVGQNIKYIRGQLGHASINMTMDVYGQLLNDLDFNRRQVELLETVRKT
jgi:integrase